MSKTNLKTNKGNLARLLATENITVLHSNNAKTASFDLKTRTIYLPVWEDMTGDLYDLLCGHEVGHAHYTPHEEWYAELDKNKKIKPCLNIIEDARIEKLIKRRYPGLSRPFAKGYHELYNRDFFGIAKIKDFSRLNIIDRINLHFKLGSHLLIDFNEQEQVFIDRVSKLETWAETVVLAYEVFEYAKEQEQDKINNMDDLTEELLRQYEDGELEDGETFSIEKIEESSEDEDSDESDDESSEGELEGGEDSDESDESSEGELDGEEGAEDSDESDDESSEGELDGEKGAEDSAGDEDSADTMPQKEDSDPDSDPESVTDEAFQKNQESLVMSDVRITNSELPEPYLDNIIVPNKYVVAVFENEIARYRGKHICKNIEHDKVDRMFMDKNNNYINLLVKEFEMYKNATQYARTTTARTGELDMSKLHQYKYSNDLFKKVSIIGKGKSHGLIMFLDMSGTMNRQFGPTMEQCLILATFCKKVGIPFDLYGFSDRLEHLNKYVDLGHSKTSIHSAKFSINARQTHYIKKDTGFHLKHLIGSSLSAPAYRRAHKMMTTISYAWSGQIYFNPNWQEAALSLGGTPLMETIICSREIVNRFNSTHQVDLVNLIYLTDGDGHDCFRIPTYECGTKLTWDDERKDYTRTQNKVVFTDRKTHKSFVASDNLTLQNDLFKFYGELTGAKTIGFYLTPSRECPKVIRDHSITGESIENSSKEMTKLGFCSIMNRKVDGYDKFYIVKTQNNDTNEELLVDENMTPGTVKNAFVKSLKNKSKNRYLITSLAKELATSL